MSLFVTTLVEGLSKLNLTDLDKLKSIILNTKGKIIILGNGGSNSIASHISCEYTKALNKPSISFSDPARLTCYANDYGYENTFKQFLKEFSESNGLVILISSSGNSKNITNCAEYCIDTGLKFITLSGYKNNNKLRSYSNRAELDFWIDNNDSGIIECIHEIILHSII
jgi:D-sedoheptulose 7-phosphate isomerase